MIHEWCEERDGPILRTAGLMPRNHWLVREIAHKMRKVPNFLGQADPYKLFLSPTTQALLVDDVGVIAALNIAKDRSAHINMTFWDRKLRGREKICRRVCDWFLKEHNLRYLYTGIQQDNAVLKAFLNRVGLILVEVIEPWQLYQYRRQ